MSGTASRYIGGVPYGPAMGVGRTNVRAVSPTAPLPVDTGVGTVTIPRPAPAVTDGMGIAVNPATGMITPVGGGGGGSGMTNLLLAAGLGLLPYAPDAINWLSNQLGGTPANAATPGTVTQEPLPPVDRPAPQTGGGADIPFVDAGGEIVGNQGSFVGPGGVPVPNAALDGLAINPDRVFEPGWVVDQQATQGLLDAPPVDGFDQMGVSPGEFASVSAPAQAAPGDITGWGQPGTLFNNPLGLGAEAVTTAPGALGSVGGFDVLANAAYIPAGIIAHGSQTLAKPGGEMGAQIGAGIGTLIGTVVGGPWGAALGALAGGGIGGQIGAAPTIGTNFGATGTFNPDGTLSFGGFGGDNGGDAATAQGFADWFGSNLLQQAGQQGLQFNPNMAGVDFNIGGFGNFSRIGTTPGGFFFDPMRGASPENYALRPGGFSSAFSPQQANEFTTAVLADLAARDVFTAGGQGRGRDFYNSTLGAPLDWYSYGGEGSAAPGTFGDILAQRQSAIGGWLGQQQQAAAAENAARAQLAQGNRWGGFDTSGISAVNLLAAQGDPTLASNLGLGGVQATENGFVFAVPGGAAGATFEPGWNTGGG